MKSVVDDKLKDDLAKAPFGVFGIEADEATDTSNESIIVTFVRSVNCINFVVAVFCVYYIVFRTKVLIHISLSIIIKYVQRIL